MAMREYCSRYSQQPGEEEEGQQDCLVPPEDVAGLSAFMKLFSQARQCFAEFLLI